jgi:hypothetical protein
VSLLIGVAILFLAWQTPRVAWFSVVVVGALIAGAFTYGWPRWVITLLAVSSVAATSPMIRFQFEYGALVPLATAVQLALELAGLVLLFLPHSTRWYRARRAGS